MLFRSGVAIVAVTHPPKASTQKAIHSFTGSLAFVAAARLAFLAVKEPDTDRRLFLGVKNNLGPLAKGLGYNINPIVIRPGIVAPCVTWDNEPVTLTANEAVKAERTATRGPSKLDQAKSLLRMQLDGRPVAQNEIERAAGAEGLSWSTIKRAKAELGIVSQKDGLGGWVWELPHVSPKAAEGVEQGEGEECF